MTKDWTVVFRSLRRPHAESGPLLRVAPVGLEISGLPRDEAGLHRVVDSDDLPLADLQGPVCSGPSCKLRAGQLEHEAVLRSLGAAYRIWHE